MKDGTTARRYAKALYQLATETKGVEDLLQSLGNILDALKKSTDLQKALRNPLIPAADKEAVIKIITSNKLALRLVRLLARRRRLELFELIFEQLQIFSDVDHGISRILVKTAIPLSDEQRRTVEKSLAASWGGKVVGSFAVAKELIGGIWLKVGDHVLDASLKGHIDDLRAALAHSIN
ncbi:MAG: ATP synthase F1 subunit delta [Elusimicrobia bacterium]|nr:ATP synthase F1 subunit delta [Candidatus Obscuribacterium magneticum]MCB4756364.1 ATP synthase F1 subunit delta [Candidatus Obscuribacterium magneticum]